MEPVDHYTAQKIARTIGFAVVAWCCVLQFIRYGGAAGQFAGADGVSTHIATAVLTIPLNWLARKAAGMPAHQMPAVAAITQATTSLRPGQPIGNP